MFGLTSWQKSMDAKQDILIKGTEEIKNGQNEIISLLRTYLPAIAAGVSAPGAPPIPPPPHRGGGDGDGSKGAGKTARMWRAEDSGQPRSL